MNTRNILGWLGITFLIAACVIGSFTYRKNFLWFWESDVSFVPDLLSGIIAAAALFPLWRKGMLAPSFRGVVAVFALLPLFYLSAVLANIGLGGNSGSLLRSPIVWLLGLILLLANINVGKYAELTLVVLIFLATWNLISASDAMKFNGFLFVAFSLAGILLTFDEKKVAKEILGLSET